MITKLTKRNHFGGGRLMKKTTLFAVALSMCIGIHTSYASISVDLNLDNPDVDMTVTPGRGKCGDNVNWSLSQDGTLTISGSGKMYDYEEFGSAPWFENNASKAILNVEVENGVESICNAAFYDTSIVSLVLPDSIKEISFASITHCNNLEYLVLSDNIESLPENSVSYNDSLTYIHMPQKLKSIGMYAFLWDSKLEEIIIPSGVTQIGDRAFSDCLALKKVVIPPQMTSIGDGVFDDCIGMEELYLPPSIENISQYAFRGCANIDKIILPDGINEIPGGALSSNDEVRKNAEAQIIYVPKSVTTFGRWAILGKNIEIHGFAGSEAEKYAKENKIPFVAVTKSMYSEEEYNSALNSQIETVPEMPVQTLTPPAKKKSVTLPASAATTYSDCDNPSVTALTNMGVLSGDGDGKFRPDDLLTRAEFSTMVSRVTGIDDMTPSDFPDESQFSDIAPGHWAFESITFCSDNTFIDGYDDGTFRPNENISIAQAVKICLSAVGYNNIIEQDNDVWYKPWIDTAYDYSLIDSKTDNPDRLISRQEAAELIYHTINMPLCVVTGFDFSNGTVVPSFRLCDGTTDEEGETMELETLYTRYVK